MLIYKITNTITGKSYIGLDRDKDGSKTNRWREHQYNASRDNNYVSKLYRSIKKHGIEHFIYEVIHDGVEDEYELITLEAAYIKQYDSITNGYNILPADLMADHSFLSEEDRKLIREAKSKGSKKANEKRWANISAEDKRAFIDRWVKSYPSDKRRKNVKEYWDSLDADERAERIKNMGACWDALSPEEKVKRGESSIKNLELATKKLSGKYKVTSPTGDVYEISALKKFCKENSLKIHVMYDVANGKLEDHDGWRVEILEKPEYKRDNANTLRIIMISPTGDEVLVDNVKQFCKTNGLHYSAMHMLKNGKIKQTKGWKMKQWWKE